jgi:hypothetical protein
MGGYTGPVASVTARSDTSRASRDADRRLRGQVVATFQTVVQGHDGPRTAVALTPRPRRARRTHLPLVALAVTLVAVGLRWQVRAPQPPAAAAIASTPSAVTSTTTTAQAPALAPPAAPAVAGPPIDIDIPAIKVHSSLTRLGRNPMAPCRCCHSMTSRKPARSVGTKHARWGPSISW